MKRMNFVYLTMILVLISTPAYCTEPSSAEPTLDQIVTNAVDEADDEINRAIELMQTANNMKFDSEENINTFFDKLLDQAQKVFFKTNNQGPLYKEASQLRNSLLTEIQIIQDKEQKLFWMENEKKIATSLTQIESIRSGSEILIAEIMHSKKKIYNNLRNKKISTAVDSLEAVSQKLESLKEALGMLKKYAVDGQAPLQKAPK